MLPTTAPPSASAAFEAATATASLARAAAMVVKPVHLQAEMLLAAATQAAEAAVALLSCPAAPAATRRKRRRRRKNPTVACDDGSSHGSCARCPSEATTNSSARSSAVSSGATATSGAVAGFVVGVEDAEPVQDSAPADEAKQAEEAAPAIAAPAPAEETEPAEEAAPAQDAAAPAEATPAEEAAPAKGVAAPAEEAKPAEAAAPTKDDAAAPAGGLKPVACVACDAPPTSEDHNGAMAPFFGHHSSMLNCVGSFLGDHSFMKILLQTHEVPASASYVMATDLLSTNPTWAAMDEQARRQCYDDYVDALRGGFVELVFQTREVTATTTYAEATHFLCSNPAWEAVDEPTRRRWFGNIVYEKSKWAQAN